jgi:outer membrane protein OmpA-like peptidoglycan-associated protein
MKYLILALILACNPLLAQTDTSRTNTTSPVRIGITAGYALNRQTADFLAFEGFSPFDFRADGGILPPNFREGAGSGIFAGVLASFPFTDALSLSLRGVFSQHNSALSTKEVTGTRTRTGGEVDTTSYFLHTLTASLPSLGVEALLQWNLFGTGVNLQAGLRGAYLLAPTYSYEQVPIFPAGGQGGFTPTFNRVRKPFPDNSAILQANPLQIHALAGIGYDIPLGEKLRITPELFYAFALTNALRSNAAQPNASSTWALHQFRGGVSVTLPLPEPPPPVIPPPPPPEIVKPAPILVINAFGVSENIGQNSSQNSAQNPTSETESVLLRIEQTISRSVFPLLPYIFFDGIGSMTLPERYATLKSEETSAFRESKLSSAYELVPKEHSYYHVLNIIGERLQRLPKATLSIHGCTDGFTAERDKAEVAKVRARVVMRYLRDVWKIDESRLKLIENTLQPSPPSIPLSETEKQAENRRVELRSDTPAILANITLIDTVRRVSPPTVRFRTDVQNLDTMRSWNVSVRQSGRLVKEFAGKGMVPKTLEWRVDERELADMHVNEETSAQKASVISPLEYTLTCVDTSGEARTSVQKTIAIETRTEEKNSKRTLTSTFFAGKLVERFNLILFGFAKSDITAEQTPMMNLMKTRITPRSMVRVDGFTDRTGDAEFNRKLSLQRALGVAQALGFTAEQQTSNVTGYGSSLELYNNDLPEGRFYSRTVRVIVETPQSE